jgi:hypothetical protein
LKQKICHFTTDKQYAALIDDSDGAFFEQMPEVISQPETTTDEVTAVAAPTPKPRRERPRAIQRTQQKEGISEKALIFMGLAIAFIILLVIFGIRKGNSMSSMEKRLAKLKKEAKK